VYPTHEGRTAKPFTRTSSDWSENKIRQAIEEVSDVYNRVIQVCLHGKNKIIQLEVLSESRILKISQNSFPNRVLISKAYAYLLFEIFSVDIYV
jgi:hypothetical protein